MTVRRDIGKAFLLIFIIFILPQAASGAELPADSVHSGRQLNAAGDVKPGTLLIPSINVASEIAESGLDDRGYLSVPADGTKTVWFNNSVKPGHTGNAVIAGHVDDKSGPAVFYNLNKLRTGDNIYVHTNDGTRLLFKVTGKEMYPEGDAPLHKIFGYTAKERLNLITCHGRFDRQRSTHSERLIIFTELAEKLPSSPTQ